MQTINFHLHTQMNKLSNQQKHYSKLNLEETNDLTYVRRGSARRGVKLLRRSLCIRVNSRTFQRLVDLSESESICQWEMLNRIILNGIPQVYKINTSKYKSNSRDSSPLIRYEWNESLLKAAPKNKKYKGAKGNHQLNLRISSTAWKQLQCLSNDIKLSKARIIQTLICEYQPTTHEFRQKQKEKRDSYKIYFADTIPAIPAIKI